MLPPSVANDRAAAHARRSAFLASYLPCGLLHELSHLAAASVLLPSVLRATPSDSDVVRFAARALLGRCCVVRVDDELVVATDANVFAIRPFGWIFSAPLSVRLHLRWKRDCAASKKGSSSWLGPSVVALMTDLFGFVPLLPARSELYAGALVFNCRNFGILLLTSTWINFDGGRGPSTCWRRCWK